MGSKVESYQDSNADYNSAEFSAMQLSVVLLDLQSILCIIPKGREGGRACNNLGRMCDMSVNRLLNVLFILDYNVFVVVLHVFIRFINQFITCLYVQ